MTPVTVVTDVVVVAVTYTTVVVVVVTAQGSNKADQLEGLAVLLLPRIRSEMGVDNPNAWIGFGFGVGFGQLHQTGHGVAADVGSIPGVEEFSCL
eukprot:CAMPEP_0194372258 /NCGR_PEP_ID=MMETSP0174-20130528/20589_1 /TAXON_ID=216777 /ORGANISM="Proboscia alata, Strain PI-D3" /LENGTH=94 /DNA_ID=CAMNT_0039150667 /DNA_START=791 /DNA_END=1071 /DNA_ORIENTATION=+